MTDPAIKLFGKTIPLRASGDFQLPSAAVSDLLLETSSSTSSSSLASSSSLNEEESQKAQQLPEKKEEDKDGSDQSPDDEDAQKKEWAGAIGDYESMETDPSAANGSDLETATETDSKTHKEQKGASNLNLKDQKTLKKPDKILPCPRCNSLDTKFCYYNNYNVNQPRHFCKNCQRYWTAGGTMRNVPVGAGRRKNKNSSSAHYRHMSLSEALQTARNEMPEAIFHPQIPLKPNGTVLSFGSDSPLCESMASVLSLTEKATRNGFHRAEEERSLENGEEHSSGSSVTASNSGEEEPLARNCQGFAPPPPPPPPPCFPAAPWTFSWNSAPWSPAPVAPPGFCASSFPMPFYPAPAAYWGCAIPGAWTIPWVSPPSASPTASNGSAPTPISPTLGKHPREGDILRQEEDSEKEEEDVLKQKKTSSERRLWIPKTLRIDDPGEAARSSIWATLGIKKGDGISGGLFGPFQSKAKEQSRSNCHNSQVLHANPAALSRSLHFHESF